MVTYDSQREKMFRRWLVPMPDAMSGDVTTPVDLSGWDTTLADRLVTPGTLRPAQVGAEQV